MLVVSIIIPCYNEEATICQLLQSIYDQTYPLMDMEVIIANGLSSDHTADKIKGFRESHPQLKIKMITNQRRVIPSGLNRAIEAASGKYILRLDAHSIPHRDYIQKCIAGLEAGLGDNIGGIWQIRPGASTWIARAIAIAAAHPLGAGDARYRIGGVAQEVDTVPFGAYRREILDKIGLFDENLHSNEDYELNVRLRQSGGKIWMDPTIHSVYYARPNLPGLSKQYWRYGYWKAQMIRKHPSTLRWRQFTPPLFVGSIVGLAVLSIWLVFARWLLATIVILYTIIIFAIGMQMSIKNRDLSLAIGLPLAIATIHLSWGTAFLWSLLFKPKLIE
jgi:succinoglycan biosynthesis protein ExoA